MAQAVEQAESLVVESNLGLIKRAGKADTRNWTAVAWLLERTHPEEFGRREVKQHQVSGKVSFDMGAALQDPQTIELMAELEARVASPSLGEGLGVINGEVVD